MGAHPTLATEEARGMRLRIGVLRQRVKANLPIEFVPQRLTSYGGLELIRRYFRRLDLRRRADQVLAAAGVRSDYGSGRLLLLVLALLVVGARRLEHLQYIGGGPPRGGPRGPRPPPPARPGGEWRQPVHPPRGPGPRPAHPPPARTAPPPVGPAPAPPRGGLPGTP